MQPHPLSGAFKRVDRASKHLSDLHAEITDYTRFKNESILMHFQDDDKGNVRPLGAVTLNYDATPDMSILVGEVIYNLRSALDYLIYELARLDSGSPQKDTQFPIESKKEGFLRGRKARLKGVNAHHVAQIEVLQPYNGCEWTKTLASISNQDKHRTLVAVSTPSVWRWHIGSDPPKDLLPGTKIRRARQADGTEMYVGLYCTVSVQSIDGKPVIETLQEVKAQVANTLQTFKPEF